MKNFQTKLDVIGNNIANVNTYGFKKGRVIFKDMISQSAGSATEPTTTRGGVNPKQVGLGSQIASIDTIQTEGSSQSTGRALDLAIAGDGYFVVGSEGGNDNFFTRAGNFYLDKEGDLVTGDGLYVLKKDGGKINIPIEAKDISIGTDGTVNFLIDGEIEDAGKIALAKFSNTSGLQKVGNNLFKESTNSGDATILNSGESGLGTIQSNMLEMSNVDLSEEFTEMIVAQRGFQANTRIITTSDEILQELVNLKR